jgi:hypothetical protein
VGGNVMSTKYGYSLSDWEKAKREMRNILIEIAKKQDTIPYSELVRKVLIISIEASSYGLADMLGEISTAEDAAGRGMLSVVVVHKEDNMPGKGFFELAKILGRDVSDKEKFWVNEVKKVYSSWVGS